MPHRFDWRTKGRVTMQFCRDCGMPGIVEDHSECPGPPDGVGDDYLAPVQGPCEMIWRDGEPVLVLSQEAGLARE